MAHESTVIMINEILEQINDSDKETIIKELKKSVEKELNENWKKLLNESKKNVEKLREKGKIAKIS